MKSQGPVKHRSQVCLGVVDEEVERGAAAGGAAVLGGVGQLRLEAGRAHGARGQHGVVQRRDEGGQLAGGGAGARHGGGGRQVCSEGRTVTSFLLWSQDVTTDLGPGPAAAAAAPPGGCPGPGRRPGGRTGGSGGASLVPGDSWPTVLTCTQSGSLWSPMFVMCGGCIHCPIVWIQTTPHTPSCVGTSLPPATRALIPCHSF